MVQPKGAVNFLFLAILRTLQPLICHFSSEFNAYHLYLHSGQPSLDLQSQVLFYQEQYLLFLLDLFCQLYG
jgi:hypothetical protein